jgi:hypothetical protein
VGWKPRVWENLGWHYSVVSADGHMKVHPGGGSCGPTRPTYYTAFFGDVGEGGRWSECGQTARAAIRNVLNYVQKEHDEVQGWLGAFTRSTGFRR